MITLPEVVRTILLARTELTDLVNDRIYADVIPQGSPMPCVMFFSLSDTAEDIIGAGEVLGFANDTIQLEGVSDRSRVEAQQVWLECNKALLGFRDCVMDMPIHSVGQSSGPRHLTDRVSEGSDQTRFRTIQDFILSYHFRETV